MSASDLESVRRENEELRRQLAEARATIRALAAHELDTVADDAGAPLLLGAAHEALRRSERQFRALFDGALDGIVITDDAGRYVDANPAACELFGMSREALCERNVADVSPSAAATERIWSELLARGQLRGEYAVVRADGTQRAIEFCATAHILPERHLAVLRDVTERKQTEAARARAEQRLQAVLQLAPMTIFAVDGQGVFTFAEGRVASSRGWAPGDVVGRDVRALYGDLPFREADGRVSRGAEVVDRALAGEVVSGNVEIADATYECRLLPHFGDDGEVAGFIGVATNVTEYERAQAELRLREARLRRVVASNISELRQAERALRETSDLLRTLVNASPSAIIVLDRQARVRLWNPAAEQLFGFTADEVLGEPVPTRPESQRAELVALIADGFQWRSRPDRCVRKGDTRVDVLISTAPLRDPSGEITGTMAVIADATEQKRLEDELRQTQKMEAVGRLAGGIAHDFNNVLQVIRGYVDELQHAVPPVGTAHDDLTQIERAVERAGNLTRQLLAFSRKQVLQPRILHANVLIENLQKMLVRVIGEDIELVTRLSPDVGCVKVDAGQFEQVILNLVLNARDAMPRGGSVTIETALLHVGVGGLRPSHDMEPGAYVMLAVSDTGIGMDRETQAHIFEPFFTSKERGKGTGLGLSTVYGIVKQSGGHIGVYSEPGHGTTFRVYLPRSGETPLVAPAPSLPPAAAPGGETVLVVEDEDLVRGLARRILARHGYEVLVANDGEEALRVAAAHAGPIHLLLTDVIMPRMGGAALAERLGGLRPELAVVFMSGYTENAIARHGILEQGTTLLEKPFDPARLLKAVRGALGERAQRAPG